MPAFGRGDPTPGRPSRSPGEAGGIGHYAACLLGVMALLAIVILVNSSEEKLVLLSGDQKARILSEAGLAHARRVCREMSASPTRQAAYLADTLGNGRIYALSGGAAFILHADITAEGDLHVRSVGVSALGTGREARLELAERIAIPSPFSGQTAP